MKILYLITKADAGGAQTHVSGLCNFFCRGGHEVAVMSGGGGWLEAEVKKSGGYFYCNRFLSNNLSPFYIFRAWLEISKVIRDFAPDIVHCHSSVAGILGRLASRGRVPTLFTAHGWSFNDGVPRWQKWLGILSEKIAARYTDKIICVCDFVMKLGLKYKIAPVDKFITIYNGVEVGLCVNVPVEREKLKIVFVGRLASPKTPIILLEAFSALEESVRGRCELLLVGAGPQRKGLEEFVENNHLLSVRFLGAQPRGCLFNILGQADIFVLLSDWEGLPYTILEAMCVGLPVLATNVGGISEAVTDKVGLLVKKRDVGAVHDALYEFIVNDKMRKEFSVAARARAVDRFSIDSMLHAVQLVYDQVIKKT